ncbi:glycosyltransferase [bacterium]|nr:glycosyltransferase [bacterium]
MSEHMQPMTFIIPTYNAVGQVESLLVRLQHFHEKYTDDIQVIVADDCSNDGTPDEVRKRFPWVEVVTSETNVGFGGNVMNGAAQARKQYLALINTDIELVGNIFKVLADALEQDQTLFATMPLIYNRRLSKVENLTRLYCHRGLCWHTELPEEEHWTYIVRDLITRSTDMKARLRDLGGLVPPIRSVLCGATFVCRREEFEALGGFDPRFRPFYWEDVDLDFRARRRGQRCAVVPTATVIHRHSETIDKYHGRRKLHFLRMNQLRFVMEHQKALMKLGLRSQHLWWAARSVRELFGGDPLLRAAYLWASIGARQV